MKLYACLTVTGLATLCATSMWLDCSSLAPGRTCIIEPGTIGSHFCSTRQLQVLDSLTLDTVLVADTVSRGCVGAPTPPPRPTVTKIAQTCDPNGDGRVSIGEVIQAVNGFRGVGCQ